MDRETKEKIFRELYEDAYKKLYTFLSRKQMNSDNVEDVIQETFLEAYSKIELLADHPNQMGWLYLTARNKMLKMMSKEKEICTLDDGPIEFLEDMRVGTVEYKDVEMTETIRNSVSGEEYEMFRDYYVNGYTHTEIAGKYGLSESSVRMRMSRMKKKLKNNIALEELIFAFCVLKMVIRL